MCVVAAELRLLLLHAAIELCCVLYDVPHYEKMPRKTLLPNNITSILYVVGRKSANIFILILGKNIDAVVVFWHRVIDRCFFL